MKINLLDYAFAGGSIVSGNIDKHELPHLQDYPNTNVHYNRTDIDLSSLFPKVIDDTAYYLVYFVKQNLVTGISFIPETDAQLDLKPIKGDKLLFILNSKETKYEFIHGEHKGHFSLASLEDSIPIDQPAFKSPHLVPNRSPATEVFKDRIS